MKKIQSLLALAAVLFVFSCGPRADKQAGEEIQADPNAETEVLERYGLESPEGRPEDDPGLRKEVTPDSRRVITDPEKKEQELQLQQREGKEQPELQLQKKEEPELQSREPN